MKEASGFLLNLVNNILDMNKLESGAVELEHKPFDLLDTLKEVNFIAKMNAELSGLTVSINHEKIRHRHLIGSPLHLKQILQNIDGNAVKCEQNVGSTFTVTIPFELDTRCENEEEGNRSASEEDVSGIHVLLVEDNEFNMEVAKFMLENAGIKVTAVFNGKEAVDAFASSKEHQFDLILMDIMMPVMDGLTATRTIRAMERSDAKEIPIFAMTANAFADDIEESRKAGMNEHLSKPLDQVKLIRKIKQYAAH